MLKIRTRKRERIHWPQYKGYGEMGSTASQAAGFGIGLITGGIIAGILGLAVGVAIGAHYERTK